MACLGRRSVRALALFTALSATGLAQRLDPAKWSISIEPKVAAPGSKIVARLTATIDPGWHLYSLSTPPPSPATKLKLADNSVFGPATAYSREPKRAFDNTFKIETQTYEGTAEFLLETSVKQDAPDGPSDLNVELRYNVCDATQCLAPKKLTLTASLTVDPKAPSSSPDIPTGFLEFKPGATPQPPPVPAPSPAQSAEGIGPFLLVAFGAGVLAIFTPCVFPMIPITMSFFLNKPSGSRGESVFQAGIFCLGIIVLFSGIGMVTSAALGPFGITRLASNPWVNGFIAAVFFVFGLSLLGAFEITLPSGMLTKLDSVSQRGGILGTLLMGLTFSLTAFACVGPFVGPLLAASAQSGGTRPLIGMAAFATGLSSPFFLLAVFPGFLKQLPRSGGWLPRVKVVMGFVVLAAMFKYLAAIDQVLQWNVLTRERFLAAWVVLFALAGLYLLGFLRLEGVAKDEPLGLGRLLSGALLLIFAISLIPGMFGGRLGDLDAYVPLPTESPLGSSGARSGLTWMKDDYRGALERGRREGKLVLVNFTGYGCANCHWMKANMFTRPEIAAVMSQYVLVELYTDVPENIAEANQKLQDRFQSNVQPFYTILDPDEKLIATFSGRTTETQVYLDFLNKGVAVKSAA